MLVGLLLALSAGPLLAGMPKALKHEKRHEIYQLEEAWRNAVLTGNATAMDGLMADDYVAITSHGTLQTRDQVLANLRTKRTHITSLEVSDRKVRFYGTTAVVTSLALVQGTNSEGEVSGSFRYTRVYVRDAHGEWKIVSFEASRILEHGESK
ncbi:MAG: nuclear transport factor 2 family protein [Terracidiphilus sp.]|nr:nuclear transport factor 2 family protein [Terracidiphilus sp.]